MSIEVNKTVDFFYLGGIIQGLTCKNRSVVGSVSVGLMGIVAAINLRDRLILQKRGTDLVYAISSLGVEILQIASGILTGFGARSLYQASIQTNLPLGTLGIGAVFSGACLSFGAVALHRWMRPSILQ